MTISVKVFFLKTNALDVEKVTVGLAAELFMWALLERSAFDQTDGVKYDCQRKKLSHFAHINVGFLDYFAV